ncbi:MAG TPA: dienelactone hydrolase family protein [Gemmataceae bacterium]|nr:dienelactone hydrolase family protein [Gemmataceae bacterium]
MSYWLPTCILLLVCPVSTRAGDDPVFDVPALLATPLNAKTLKTTQRENIITEEVSFHSEMDGEKNVEIFAYFSYPQGAKNLPAYIWNPGGLGQASPAYTEAGARRGYATLCIDFPQPGYRSTGGYPINAGLDLGADLRQAPIYHGAVALLKAVSFLESRPEVDRSRIGMAGSSWGGFFTTLMAGLDQRLKACSCFFGTGSLQLGNAWWDGQSRNGRPSPSPAYRERWAKTLDPAWRLQKSKVPIAWFTGTNDGFYYLPSVMRTYQLAAGPKHLSLLPNWDHAVSLAVNEQAFAWLDIHLKGKAPFLSVSPSEIQERNGRQTVRWTFQGEAAAAELNASFQDEGHWHGRYWHTFKADVRDHTCSVELPSSTLPCYVIGNVIDKAGFRSSTPMRRIEPSATADHSIVPSYDGCSDWGGFEENQLAFLSRHYRSGSQVRWLPQVSLDAKDGKQSALLPVGKTPLPPILFTPDIPHRFTCFLKSDKPVEAILQLEESEKRIAIGTSWTEVRMDYTPSQSLLAAVHAALSVPPGANLLLDCATFRPIVPSSH